jgi:hypothetical protein
VDNAGRVGGVFLGIKEVAVLHNEVQVSVTHPGFNVAWCMGHEALIVGKGDLGIIG